MTLTLEQPIGKIKSLNEMLDDGNDTLEQNERMILQDIACDAIVLGAAAKSKLYKRLKSLSVLQGENIFDFPAKKSYHQVRQAPGWERGVGENASEKCALAQLGVVLRGGELCQYGIDGKRGKESHKAYNKVIVEKEGMLGPVYVEPNIGNQGVSPLRNYQFPNMRENSTDDNCQKTKESGEKCDDERADRKLYKKKNEENDRVDSEIAESADVCDEILEQIEECDWQGEGEQEVCDNILSEPKKVVVEEQGELVVQQEESCKNEELKTNCVNEEDTYEGCVDEIDTRKKAQNWSIMTIDEDGACAYVEESINKTDEIMIDEESMGKNKETVQDMHESGTGEVNNSLARKHGQGYSEKGITTTTYERQGRVKQQKKSNEKPPVDHTLAKYRFSQKTKRRQFTSLTSGSLHKQKDALYACGEQGKHVRKLWKEVDVDTPSWVLKAAIKNNIGLKEPGEYGLQLYAYSCKKALEMTGKNEFFAKNARLTLRVVCELVMQKKDVDIGEVYDMSGYNIVEEIKRRNAGYKRRILGKKLTHGPGYWGGQLQSIKDFIKATFEAPGGAIYIKKHLKDWSEYVLEDIQGELGVVRSESRKQWISTQVQPDMGNTYQVGSVTEILKKTDEEQQKDLVRMGTLGQGIANALLMIRDGGNNKDIIRKIFQDVLQQEHTHRDWLCAYTLTKIVGMVGSGFNRRKNTHKDCLMIALEEIGKQPIDMMVMSSELPSNFLGKIEKAYRWGIGRVLGAQEGQGAGGKGFEEVLIKIVNLKGGKRYVQNQLEQGYLANEELLGANLQHRLGVVWNREQKRRIA